MTASVTFRLAFDDATTVQVAEALAAAYLDGYAGFSSDGEHTTFLFELEVPADLEATLATFAAPPTTAEQVLGVQVAEVPAPPITIRPLPPL